MQALRENDTFELTPLPEGRKTVGGRWVYAIKQGPNDEEKYKARFVAKGYSQVAEIDYHETFSPTANLTSIRILIQLAVQFNLTVHQMDVKSAYLKGPIDCELFVEQPEGFTIASEDGKHLVCKLKKSLYGLKQSGRNWNSVLHSYLVSEGFTQSQADYCVYTKITNESLTVVVIWVDDLIIASSCIDRLMNVKKNLGTRFKRKDLGKLSWFLCLEFICEAEYMSLAAAVQEAKFLFQLLESILDATRNMFTSITLYCDSQGALALAKNPVQHQRSKHIDIRYHFVKAEIQKQLLNLVYVASKDNLADMFTKPIPGPRMKTFVPLVLGK